MTKMFSTARNTGPLYAGLLRSVCAAALALGMAASLPASAQEAAAAAISPYPRSLRSRRTSIRRFSTRRRRRSTPSNRRFRRKVRTRSQHCSASTRSKLKADENTDDTLAAIKEGAAKQLLLDGEGDRRTVQIGEKLWPLPFPIVKGEDGKWAFDTFDGLEEIVNRRVGENELATIETMRAYVDAQEDYASGTVTRTASRSSRKNSSAREGMTDGIYWPTDDINGESPAGDLDQSELDDAAKGEGYFGYKYKILTGQGDHIAGGAYDYIINGNMIAGFGLIAWPAKYGETGVKTFAVNQHGVVYETDLGPTTAGIVKYIDRFNPDETWEIVVD